MLSKAQHGMLSPVVTTAWKRHCALLGLDPGRKKDNAYRAWYEGVLRSAAGFTSSRQIRTAKEFGAVLQEFAQIADDEVLIRRLADDEERRLRWVLRMLCVDLSFLRGQTIGWDYILGCFKQARLPPGDFDNCPAEYLDKIVGMIDTQIRRECEALHIRKKELPRRAKYPDDAGDAIAIVAAKYDITIDDLKEWCRELLDDAERDIRRGRTHDAPWPSVTTDSGRSDVPF